MGRRATANNTVIFMRRGRTVKSSRGAYFTVFTRANASSARARRGGMIDDRQRIVAPEVDADGGQLEV